MTTAVSQPPVPLDEIEQHRGKWLAIRGGTTIIAVGDDLDDLRENDLVIDTDAVLYVPENGALFF